MAIKASQIIIALDFACEQKALAMVRLLMPYGPKFKVGKEMFTRFGPDFIRKLTFMGCDVFLDLKFHDIPHTVYKALEAVANLDVWLTNVHALGGKAMMEQAVSALSQKRTKLIAVTVLTSMDDLTLQTLNILKSAKEQTLDLARLAKEAGMDGVVASAIDVSDIKKTCGHDFLSVTPGIRLSSDAGDDQKRIMTPEKAITNGSDYLVIGRPITKAKSPEETLEKLLQDN